MGVCVCVFHYYRYGNNILTNETVIQNTLIVSVGSNIFKKKLFQITFLVQGKAGALKKKHTQKTRS